MKDPDWYREISIELANVANQLATLSPGYDLASLIADTRRRSIEFDQLARNAKRHADDYKPAPTMSTRDRKIVALSLSRSSDVEIAREVGLTEGRVMAHRFRLIKKFRALE